MTGFSSGTSFLTALVCPLIAATVAAGTGFKEAFPNSRGDPRRPRYTACAPGRFGPDCSGLCQCDLNNSDCDDGPTGFGGCECALGHEKQCGLDPPPSYEQLQQRLLPFLAGVNLTSQTIDDVRVDSLTFRRVRQVYNATVSRVRPVPFRARNLELCAYDRYTAKDLELELPTTAEETKQFNNIFSGRLPLPGSKPFAHAYGGHQFGNWAGQLGDGRAISIGNRLGYEISLKGAGRTPYSRRGDGRAVLRSLSREFLAGAHLRALGVPAVAALALIGADLKNGLASGDFIVRDEYYTGFPQYVRSGILVRASPSFIRFGSLQLARKRQGWSGLVQLARHVLRVLRKLELQGDPSWHSYFKADGGMNSVKAQFKPKQVHAQCFFAPVPKSCSSKADSANGKDVLSCLLLRTSERIAALVAAWQSVGLAHGVMNTDNLSALGLTIDLNVFGWIGDFRAANKFVPNYIDDDARYAFGNQKSIALWNLYRLVETFAGFKTYVADREDEDGEKMRSVYKEEEERFNGGGKTKDAERRSDAFLPKKIGRRIVKDVYSSRFDQCFNARMRWRLGLTFPSPLSAKVISLFMDWMKEAGADYHLAFRSLAEFDHQSTNQEGAIGSMAKFITQASTMLGASVEPKGDMSIDVDFMMRGHADLLKTFLITLRKAVLQEQPDGIERDEWWKAWQHHVRSANPRYIMRTRTMQKIGTATEKGEQEIIREAWETLSSPFLLKAGRQEFFSANRGNGISKDLASIPDPEDGLLQTSCGGQ